jgi:signal peptidase I
MRRKRTFFQEFPVLVVVALVVSLFIKTFIVQFFFIPSGSMENTLQIDDRVAVNRLPFISNNINVAMSLFSVTQIIGCRLPM